MSDLSRANPNTTECPDTPGTEDPFEVEYERLIEILISQVEHEAYAEARATVEQVLLLKPRDEAALQAKEFLDHPSVESES